MMGIPEVLMIRVVCLALLGCVVAACGSPTPVNSCQSTETDVGCGGACPPCGLGRHCRVGADCASGICTGGICSNSAPSTCSDGRRDGSETDVDCGGPVCPPCAAGRICLIPSDCVSGLTCTTNLCVAPGATPSCSNGVRDGNESDVDCGGSCAPCADGRTCRSGADCQSQTCSAANRCVEPTSGGPPNTGGAPVYPIDAGAAIAIQPGTQAGYGITANVGNSYRIIWTGDGNTSAQYREFYGSVWTSGAFATVTPGCSDGSCPLGSGDYISQPYAIAGGERVDFDTFAISNIEGFDFTVTTEPVYFDLYIDGQHYPDLVFFSSGGIVSSTASFPFGLTTQ
jgi:hypothetical protein